MLESLGFVVKYSLERTDMAEPPIGEVMSYKLDGFVKNRIEIIILRLRRKAKILRK
jgi:hypothetical protein